MDEHDVALRQWAIQAAIDVYASVVKSLPPQGATVNIDILAEAQKYYDFATGKRS